MLDNRELAIYSWVLIFIFVLLISKGTRKSILDFVKCLAEPYIFRLISITLLWMCIVTYLLSLIPLWSFANLKISILWILLVGIPFLFDDYKKIKGKDIFKKIILKSISPIILIELISNIKTFNFGIEFLLFPLQCILALIVVFTDLQPELQKAKPYVQLIIICFGIWFLVKGIIVIINDYNILLNLETLAKIGLPIIYSLAFSPFVFLFVIYMEYEQILVRIKLFYKDDKKLIGILKRNTFKSCGLSLRKIRNVSRFPYHIANKVNNLSIEITKYAKAQNEDDISSLNVLLIESIYK